jgi:5-methylcytosine-specific restriction protein A
MPARNPPWEIDEILLALDVYFQFPEARQSKAHPEVSALSEALRALPLHAERPDPASFRNLNGAFMKLQNLKAVDPDYTASGRVGLSRGVTARERELWGRYADHQEELHDLAQRIRSGTAEGTIPTTPEDEEEGVLEGRIVWRWHRQRERAPRKAAEKKRNMRAELGELRCEVCGFSEAEAVKRFGTLTGDIFECHHTKPLHLLTGTTKTRVADLAVVCPTCHRSLHRIEPPVSVAELRARVMSADPAMP